MMFTELSKILIGLTKDTKFILNFEWAEYEMKPILREKCYSRREVYVINGERREHKIPCMYCDVHNTYVRKSQRRGSKQMEGIALSTHDNVFFAELLGGKSIRLTLHEQEFPFKMTNKVYEEETDTLVLTMRQAGDCPVGYKLADYKEQCEEIKNQCDEKNKKERERAKQVHEAHIKEQQEKQMKIERERAYASISPIKRFLGGEKLRKKYLV